MRTFILVEALPTHDSGNVDDGLGLASYTVYYGHAYFPKRGRQMAQRVTKPRYDAEAIAIEANEPLRDIQCDDATYFALCAAESARELAQQVLEKIHRKKSWVNHNSDNLDELEIISERVDPAPGTHMVKYHSDIDTIEIVHTAHNRQGFATGAVLAAEQACVRHGLADGG